MKRTLSHTHTCTSKNNIYHSDVINRYQKSQFRFVFFFFFLCRCFLTLGSNHVENERACAHARAPLRILLIKMTLNDSIQSFILSNCFSQFHSRSVTLVHILFHLSPLFQCPFAHLLTQYVSLLITISHHFFPSFYAYITSALYQQFYSSLQHRFCINIL